jgi:hypothetical protein
LIATAHACSPTRWAPLEVVPIGIIVALLARVPLARRRSNAVVRQQVSSIKFFFPVRDMGDAIVDAYLCDGVCTGCKFSYNIWVIQPNATFACYLCNSMNTVTIQADQKIHNVNEESNVVMLANAAATRPRINEHPQSPHP